MKEKKRAKIGKIVNWILVVIIIVSIGSVLVPMSLVSEDKRRHMETVAVPLIEALDRYREANKSYPESLDELVPMYLPDIPSCNPKSSTQGLGYFIDKDSGEYDLTCGIGMMFLKRQYSSKTREWETLD